MMGYENTIQATTKQDKPINGAILVGTITFTSVETLAF